MTLMVTQGRHNEEYPPDCQPKEVCTKISINKYIPYKKCIIWLKMCMVHALDLTLRNVNSSKYIRLSTYLKTHNLYI